MVYQPYVNLCVPCIPARVRVSLSPRYGQVGEGRRAARGDDGAGTAEEGAAAGRDLQRRAARWLPALAGMAVARTTLAARVVPRDGLPALGWGGGEAAGTYVCAAHSGVTLAPLLGALAAAEIVDGGACELVDPAWRPDRFAKESTPYN